MYYMAAKVRNIFQMTKETLKIYPISLYFTRFFVISQAVMITDELTYRIKEAFGHVPTAEQEVAIETFARFMSDRREEAVMVMRGSAGTGKTTLAAAIVKALTSLGQKLILLAPTGRAAKVFSLYANHPAYTIHRRIYRQKSLEERFDLNFNAAQDTLFIVDEASMVANTSTFSDTIFAGGQLMDDLIRFVYNGRNCRMMFIGDQAQLPPVGETESPALQADVLRGYGLHVHQCTLNEVLRQSQESGILWNATDVRSLMSDGGCTLPKVRFKGFEDIRNVPGDELIETLASSYSRVGLDDTIVITRSNKRANIYNQGIRNQVLDRDDMLCRGDQLMIVKNNYYWMKEELAQAVANGENTLAQELPMEFIANGDRAIVRKVRNVHEQHGFHFAEVTMTFPDYDDYELTATTLLATLTSEAPALTREQQELLYNKVLEDYADIPFKADRLKKLREDRYYNALQVKFAYAATCHKAQGGQWAHVYVDQGYMTDDMLSYDYLHWLYTAFTRATERLYLVNWPDAQTI
jgi:tRNA A37 threonylcarbamoyladenosine biosynthesis protein TsaE